MTCPLEKDVCADVCVIPQCSHIVFYVAKTRGGEMTFWGKNIGGKFSKWNRARVAGYTVECRNNSPH